MKVETHSHCKINLLLNILGKRADGFHELETILQPVQICDTLELSRKASPGIELTCTDASLPVDSRNLVYRAAEAFLETAGARDGVRIRLEKRIPHAAGLGGGSGNAATTLRAMNELFGGPLSMESLYSIAAALGSDVPFFLQSKPALATGRGERITPLEAFPALTGTYLVLVHPGFGISTAWAYQQLARFPDALHGRRGRAEGFTTILQTENLARAGEHFYNSLEQPALQKYPILELFQEFFREQGSPATMMSGSGSCTFAIFPSESTAAEAIQRFPERFGETCWLTMTTL